MIMYNADGSRGKMCGNGVRCVGKYAYDHGLAVKPEITVETDAGIKTLTMQVQDGRAVGARVDWAAAHFCVRVKSRGMCRGIVLYQSTHHRG
jgi:diaminopimelate epimerase